MKNKGNVYLPNERTNYKPSSNALNSQGSEGKGSTKLPSTVEDDIVVNNISSAEFDYTESMENK